MRYRQTYLLYRGQNDTIDRDLNKILDNSKVETALTLKSAGVSR